MEKRKSTHEQPFKVRKRGDAHAHTQREIYVIFFSILVSARVRVRCSLFVWITYYPKKRVTALL